MSTRTATLTLGRDGMGGESDEADFDAWVAYVSAHIDEATGLDVTVDTRGKRDVQDDRIRATSDDPANSDDAQTIRDALVTLWDAFCADTAAWPSREVAS